MALGDLDTAAVDAAREISAVAQYANFDVESRPQLKDDFESGAAAWEWEKNGRESCQHTFPAVC